MTNTTTTVTSAHMTVNDIATYLISQGVAPLDAVTQAQAQINAQSVEPVIVTPQKEEAPVAPKQEEAQEVKVAKRPWFKRATDKMFVSDKDVLIGNLVVEKMNAKTKEEKAEIEKLIVKLETKESFYAEKVEPFLAKSKGWAVGTSGKVADGLYLTGEYTNKGASGLTKAIGKGIAVTGEFIEGQAPNVGKVVEAPFKLAGDAINIVNGTKKMPKPTHSTTKEVK